MGCDNRAMLNVARHKLGQEIDVAYQLLQHNNMEEQFGSIAMKIGKHIFQRGGHSEPDGLEMEDSNMEFSDNPSENSM